MRKAKVLRPGAYLEVQRPLSLMGFDFLAEIEVRVTDFGQGPTGLNGPPEFSDPGWGAEFEVEEIILHLDEPGRFGPAFVTNGALFEGLAAHFSDDISEAIALHEPEPNPWDEGREYDEDYYRDDR